MPVFFYKSDFVGVILCAGMNVFFTSPHVGFVFIFLCTIIF